MVKDGAVIVDVGINFVEDPERKSGKKMVGDVSPDVYPTTKAYSPVPGGVGPMTVAMLMRNVLVASYTMQCDKNLQVKPLSEGWRAYART